MNMPEQSDYVFGLSCKGLGHLGCVSGGFSRPGSGEITSSVRSIHHTDWLCVFAGVNTGGCADAEKTTHLNWYPKGAKAFGKDQEKVLSDLVCYLLHCNTVAYNPGFKADGLV